VALALVAWRLGPGSGGGGGQPAPAGGAATAPAAVVEAPDAPEALVHVTGEVRRPGVYRLAAGARANEAVRRAGGPTRRADLSALNLAAKLEDGRQVLVPLRGAAAAGAAAGGAAAPAEGQPLDLNTASAEQLDQLDGIGPGMAAAILKYREQHGGFGSVEELGEVPGIGEKRLASLREQVRV